MSLYTSSNIVAALVAKGEHVRVLDNLATGYWENLDGIAQQSQIERVTGDIRDAATIKKACEGVEVVFHEAALQQCDPAVLEVDSVPGT